MAVVVDSSVFIALERKGLPLGSLAAEMQPDEPVALAAITASELLVGVRRAATQAQRLARESVVEAILGAFPILPFDLQAARIHAGLSADLFAAGQAIGAHDLLIAATALAHGYNVLTDNLRHFGRVPGLDARRPAW